MQKICIIILILLSGKLYGQTYGAQQVKTFYYDIDNFSLTPESMKLLASFVQEVKESPIEILRIVGYVEKEGGETYNKIKSKKRMENLKQTLDTALVIQQYQPLNLEFAPAFLYSYDDGYNFRRVDITYRHVYIFKNINLDNKTLNKLASNNSKSTNSDTTQRKSTNFNIDSDDGSVQHYQGSESENLSTIINHQSNQEKNNISNNETTFFKKLFNKKELNNDLTSQSSTQEEVLNSDSTDFYIDSSLRKTINDSTSYLNGYNDTEKQNITKENGNIKQNEINSDEKNILTETKTGFWKTIFNKKEINSKPDSLINSSVNSLSKDSNNTKTSLDTENETETIENDGKTIKNEIVNETEESIDSNQIKDVSEETKSENSEITLTNNTNKKDLNTNDKQSEKNEETSTIQKHKNYTEKKEIKETAEGKKTITIIEVKDNNQNLPISIERKSQDEIDNIVVRSRGYAKNQKIETLDEQLSRVNINSLKDNVVLITLNIQFIGNEPVITSSSLKEMTNLFVFLQSNPSVDAFIRGHVCCGDEMGLSRKRAKHVYSELIKKGIDKDRLRHNGFSNTLPVVFPERNEADRRRNRRVDVILSGNNNRTIVQNFDTTINESQVTKVNKESNAAEVFEDKAETTNSKKSLTSLTVELEDEMNGLINVEGRSQVEIDYLKVKAKKSKYKQGETISLTLEQQLAKVDIRKLNKSIFLVTLSIQFSNNKPILDDISNKELNDIFTYLYENPELKAFIRGHVCCGNEMNLSTKRAKYIYKELIKRGIDKKRLRFQGFSNHLPLVFPERTDDDRNKNRRIDIILSK